MIALDANGADRGPATVAEGGRLAGVPVTLYGPAPELVGFDNVVDSPVALEIDTERASFFVRDDLTIRHVDGRIEKVAERRVETAGRGYWGVSHQRLIADFYARLDEPEPFWISPGEATKSLRIIAAAYEASGFGRPGR